MYRVRIETLEKRKMFSVTDLILDPFNAEVATATESAESAAIVDYIDEDDAGRPISVSGKMHLEDISLGIVAAHGAGGPNLAALIESLRNDTSDGDDYVATESMSLNFGGTRFDIIARHPDLESDAAGSVNHLAGDFNSDGRDELASTLYAGVPIASVASRIDTGVDYNHPDLFGSLSFTLSDFGRTIGAPSDNNLLPFVEQDSVYNLHDATGRIAEITDGTSNTLMLTIHNTGPSPLPYLVQHGTTADGIIAVLIGLAADPKDKSGNTAGLHLLGVVVDTSAIDLASSAPSIDVWEHAYLVQPAPAANGILIGLLVPEAISTPTGTVTFALAVDPSNPNVVYVGGSHAYLAENSLGPAYVPTNGIIAVLIGLTVDPSDPSGNT